MGLEYRFEDLPAAFGQMHELLLDIKRRLLKLEQTKDVSDELLDVQQAAELLRISVRTLYDKTSKREVPFCKFGKNLFFSRNKLTDCVLEHAVRSRSEIDHEARSYERKMAATPKR